MMYSTCWFCKDFGQADNFSRRITNIHLAECSPRFTDINMQPRGLCCIDDHVILTEPCMSCVNVIITRDSEVIMFSPCVFVFVCLFFTMFVRAI